MPLALKNLRSEEEFKESISWAASSEREQRTFRIETRLWKPTRL
jgi:hypothetical protein